MRIISILAVFAVLASVSYAALPVNATVTAGTPLTLTSSATSGTVGAWGGNVTPVNLVINSSTLHWQGFFGNITGSLGLGYGTSLLKKWTISTAAGQVYASQASVIDFTALNSTSVTLANMDSAFSFLSGATDSAANSGTNTNNTFFNISHYQVPNNTRPTLFTMNSSGALVWETVVLTTNASDSTKYVFAGLISNNGVAADGTSADFQIMVPEDSLGNLAATTYYFYGEVR